MNPKLQSILDCLADTARFNLESFGQLMPCAFLMTDNPVTCHVIACPWKNDEDKERAIIAMRERARAINATTFVMLAEAWRATLTDGKWDGTPASKMPTRKEIVHMYVESDDDGYWMGMADITRANGKPSFGALEWQPLPERAAFERFQRILA